MSVVFFKALSIAIRTLARPLINYVSYYNRLKVQESNNKVAIVIRGRLIWLGQTFNYYNTRFNRAIFKLATPQAIKPLADDKALERGAELISEFIVYSILLIIPTLEMIKSYKSGKAKEEKKKDFLINIQKDIDTLIEKNHNNIKEVKDIKQILLGINTKMYIL